VGIDLYKKDFNYKDVADVIGQDFCQSEVFDCITLVESIPVTDKFHGYEIIDIPFRNLLGEKLDYFGFVSGKPDENTIDKRPEAFFIWTLASSVNAYEYPPAYHHGPDTLAKESFLRILTSIFNEMRDIKTKIPTNAKSLFDLSYPGTSKQVFHNRKGKFYIPDRKEIFMYGEKFKTLDGELGM
jgi:hypothetical protein